jgi:hypothetical protein
MYSRSLSFPFGTEEAEDRHIAQGRQTISCDDASKSNAELGKKYFGYLKSKISALLSDMKWNERRGFDDDCDPEKLKRFYIVANQLLIFAEKIPQCLLCGCTRGEESRSHIFPKCLLQQYGKIHSTGERFIWDISRKPSRRPMAASELSFPLFCDTCEQEASKEEGFLRDTYLRIMAAGMEKSIELNDGDYARLKYILAVILFRGALQAINICQEILIPGYSNNFFENFAKLRSFCLKKRHQD